MSMDCILQRGLELIHPDAGLMTLAPSDGSYDFQTAYEEAYKAEFGFLLNLTAVVDDVRVRGIGKTVEALPESVYAEVERVTFAPAPDKKEGMTSMYFEETGRLDVPVFLLSNLQLGDSVNGPAAIVDGTQTLVLTPRSLAKIASQHVFVTLS